MMNNPTIAPITEGNMLDDIVELHLEAFAGYSNTLLGRGYIKAFITWFFRNKGTIAIVALDDHQKVVGYALCAPAGYAARLNRDLFWGTAVRILTRPWLICNARFRGRLAERIKSLVGPRQNSSQALELPEPSMSLVAIGVASANRRSKIGQCLIQAVESRARSLYMRSLVLSVYEDATAARRFYEQCGWRLGSSVVMPRALLKYFRLLDDTQSGVA
jgi:ribosomal protein S18 acetylase RimI-like enzyme